MAGGSAVLHEGVVVGNGGGYGIACRRCDEQEPELIAAAETLGLQGPVSGDLEVSVGVVAVSVVALSVPEAAPVPTELMAETP